jgi:hypothetical protein
MSYCKEVKVISEVTEARMRDLARESIEHLAEVYPAAREIDLLNAYLRVFTRRVSDEMSGE